MRGDSGPALRGEQRAVQRLLPGQLLQSSLLELPLLELQARLETELERNPALERIEGPACPACGAPLSRGACPECGPCPARLDRAERGSDYTWAGGAGRPEEADESPWSERVPAVLDVRRALLEEARLDCPAEDLALLGVLVESLDSDGYLRESLMDLAAPLHRTVPDAERILRIIQSLDPPGIGARGLRECLRLQAERMAERLPEAVLILRILDEGWELLAARRIEALARELGLDLEAIQSALHLLRKRFSPAPLAAIPEPPSPWSRAGHVQPEIRFSRTEGRIGIEVPDPFTRHFRIDGEYRRLERLHKKTGGADAEAAHVREAVGSARMLLDGLARRRETLITIAEALAELQAAFIMRGPRFLEPLTRKTLAARLGLHESTISRAVAGKWAELPGGGSIPLDRFFQAADSPKELLRDLVATEDLRAPLTDSDLMRAMEACGFKIARRTVAKYRESLGIPPVDLRRGA